jgi:SAM-dependent methyltransferase
MASIVNGTGAVVDRPGDYWRVPAAAQDYERVRFHDVRGRLYRWLEERAIERALRGLRSGSTVLDAPCGTGRLLALVRRQGLRPTGCDISIAMMTVARQKLTSPDFDVPLVASDIQSLPYPEKSFDVAICVGLLMHLDADARVGALRQLARVARDRLVVQYGCLDGFNRIRSWMTGRPAGNVRYPVTEREMRRDFERSGLTERARFRVLRGFSSSVVIVLTAP